MPCGGCGKKSVPLRDVPKPNAPRSFASTPPPPPAPAPTRTLPRPASIPRANPRTSKTAISVNQTNITVKSETRVCPKCGQKGTFRLQWNERLRRYFEVSACPCEALK